MPAGGGIAVDGGRRSAAHGGAAELGGVGRGAGHTDPGALPFGMHEVGVRHRIVRYEVVGAPRVAGGTDRRAVVVDLAVVGLTGGGGVGDEDVVDGQTRAVRVGGEQGGAGAARLGVVEAQQGLGAALHPGHVGRVHRVRPDRSAGQVHAVDLDRRVRRPQVGVGGEALLEVPGDLVAELRDPDQPGGTLDRPVHEHRPRRRRRLRVEVVADHHVPDALTAQRRRQPRGGPAVGDVPLHRVQGPDRARRHEGHGVAGGPRRRRERLEGLVAGQAPDLAAEGGARHDQRAFPTGVLVEPRGGLVPVSGHRIVGTARGEPAGPRERRREGQRHEDQGGERDHGLPLGMRERGPGLPPRHRAGQRHPAQQMREPEHERQPHQRLELVHVAQRGAGRIQEVPDLLGDRRAEVTDVPGGQPGDAGEQDQRPPPPGGHRTHRQSRQARGREQTGDEDRRGLGDQHRAGDALGGDERGPAVGAAQHLRQRGPLRGHPGRFDVVQERRADAAEQQQRHDPPQHRDDAGRDPPQREPPPSPVRAVCQPPQPGDEARGDGGDGVDRTHERDGDGGLRCRSSSGIRRCRSSSGIRRCRSSSGIRPVAVEVAHERQQHPRRQHHRQRLRRDGSQGGQHAGGERERRRGDQPGTTVTDAERLREPHHAPEPGEQQQRPPHPLGDPRGDVQELADGEEGTVREEVAVRLVLYLAERRDAAPLVGGAGEEPEGILGQVVLGVGDDQAGGLRERQQQRHHGGPVQPPPGEGVGGRCPTGVGCRAVGSA